MLAVSKRTFSVICVSSSSKYGKYYFVLLNANYRKICCLQPSSHPFSAVRFLFYYSVRLAYKKQADNYCINFYVSLQPSSHPFSAVRFFVYYSVRLAYKRQADIFHYTFALKSLFRVFRFVVLIIHSVLLRPSQSKLSENLLFTA